MKKTDERSGVRRPYEAPRLGKVKVRLDEAVLQTCKVSEQLGPAVIGCGTCVSQTS
jgi:hypothetical protein